MSDEGCSGSETERRERRERTYDAPLQPNGGLPTLEDLFKSFASPRRRFVLYYLRDHEIATVEELARQIVARDASVPPDEVPSDRREHVETQLVHADLPKLAAATFVEYDNRSKTVRYAHPPALLESALDMLEKLERESGE